MNSLTFFEKFIVGKFDLKDIFDKSINIKNNEVVLYQSDFYITNKISHTFEPILDKGYFYLSVDVNSIKLNDGLNKEILPKQVYIFKKDFFNTYKKNIEDLIKNKAFENIYRFSNNKFSSLDIKLPKVSVIVTNYNYENYLEECLESILNQDYPYIERFIVDDVSTDGSLDIIENYSNRYKILRHSENKGQLKGFFTGLEEAQGSFIVYVDADDVLDSHAISAGLSVHLLESTSVAFSSLRNRQIDENSEVISNFHSDFSSMGQKHSYIGSRIIHKPFWRWSTTSAMMFRKSVLDLIKIDDTDAFRICADYYMVHFSNLLGGSILFDVDSVGYRRHGKNNFSKNFIIGGKVPTGHFVIDNHPEHKILSKTILEHMWQNKDKFERYFNSYDGYVRRLAMVAPFEFANEVLQMDSKTKNMYQSFSDEFKSRLEEFRNEGIKNRKMLSKKVKKLKSKYFIDYEINNSFQM